jgi:hypothetical protein
VGQAIATGAKFVLGATWNDYAENTQKQPSRDLGRAPLWFNKFYSDWWRTGVMPTITDRRSSSPTGSTPRPRPTTAGLTPTAHTLDGGGTYPYDKTEALVFADQDYQLFVNGVDKGTVHAGVTPVQVALVTGQKQTAVLKLAGVTVASVTSADTPTTTPPRFDYVYRWAESAA